MAADGRGARDEYFTAAFAGYGRRPGKAGSARPVLRGILEGGHLPGILHVSRGQLPGKETQGERPGRSADRRGGGQDSFKSRAEATLEGQGTAAAEGPVVLEAAVDQVDLWHVIPDPVQVEPRGRLEKLV